MVGQGRQVGDMGDKSDRWGAGETGMTGGGTEGQLGGQGVRWWGGGAGGLVVETGRETGG